MSVTHRADETDHASYSWQLIVKLEELAHFRRLAGCVMREWGQCRRVREMVLHGVTELLANVHQHADDPRCLLEIVWRGEAIHVTVFDGSSRLPVVEKPDWCSESGRGLWLLREMADGFGYGPAPGGKRVWIRVEVGDVAAGGI
ncbi:ATP-binding protein [Streptomyces sp. N2-109]|uniref:ATP-binding protein n=1 Tax=Streptomyces gossypii TaxID=2883101 RepID=A0ABT2K3Y2_9ACTN|nr:ATP-binding protein [Streptomyces gossypii]MCT2594174.1 ATP-binding protein [Streptomyces gossypii]